MALTAAALGACDSPRSPLSLAPGVSASGAGSGSGLTSIAGTWRRILVVTTPMDVVTSETTWSFSAGGGCERVTVTASVLEGVPITQRASCSYSVAGGRVTVRFAGSAGPVSFTLAFSGGRLLLDGVEFQRIG